MQVTISKLHASSLAFVLGILYAIFGLIAGIFVSIFSFAAPGVGALGAVAIIVLPIVYGLCGLVGGFISAWLYNLVASWVGGIKFDTK